MKAIYAISLSIATTVLVSGCGNNSSSSGQTPASTNTTSKYDSGNPTTAPADYIGAVGQAQKFSEKTIDLAYVKQGIQMFQASEGHYPKTLQDLVPNYIGKVPTPPKGYKISYNPNTGEVKVVKE